MITIMNKSILLFFLSILAFSCNSSDDSSSAAADDGLTNVPEAKAEFDDSNFGVYKGIFVGSSGIVYVNINNTGSVSAKLTIDGVVHNFTTSENVTEGLAINSMTFTSGSNSFEFNVSATGEEPLIENIVINGHPNPYIQLFKEYSFAQIKCYLGTYTGDDSGVFNLATTADGYALGLVVPNGETSAIYLDGTITETSLSGTFEGGIFSGTISGNTISGTWQNSVPENGTWSGIRKL